MGVRISNSPHAVDRCRLRTVGYLADGVKRYISTLVTYSGWRRHVNLWCPRPSVGRRACKQRGCCAELPLLEKVDG